MPFRPKASKPSSQRPPKTKAAKSKPTIAPLPAEPAPVPLSSVERERLEQQRRTLHALLDELFDHATGVKPTTAGERPVSMTQIEEVVGEGGRQILNLTAQAALDSHPLRQATAPADGGRVESARIKSTLGELRVDRPAAYKDGNFSPSGPDVGTGPG